MDRIEAVLTASTRGFSSARGHTTRYIKRRSDAEHSNRHVFYTDSCN